MLVNSRLGKGVPGTVEKMPVRHLDMQLAVNPRSMFAPSSKPLFHFSARAAAGS